MTKIDLTVAVTQDDVIVKMPSGIRLVLTIEQPSGFSEPRYVMKGARSGIHTLSVKPADTNAERLAAHWDGYVANAINAEASRLNLTATRAAMEMTPAAAAEYLKASDEELRNISAEECLGVGPSNNRLVEDNVRAAWLNAVSERAKDVSPEAYAKITYHAHEPVNAERCDECGESFTELLKAARVSNGAHVKVCAGCITTSAQDDGEFTRR